MSTLTVQALQPFVRLAVKFSPAFPRLWGYVVKVRKHYAQSKPPLEIETVFEGDIKVRTLLSDHIEAQLFWQGFQEADEGVLRLIKQHLPPDGIFIDIGANIGSFTLVAARIAPRGKVHAFEPSDHHFTRLSKNVGLNHFENVVLNKQGLNDKTECATLFLPSLSGEMNNSGAASLYSSTDVPGMQVTEEVELITLDDYVQANKINQVDLIKIDIEGAEFNALKGSIETLKRFRPIVLMELDLDNMQRAQCSPNEILDFWHTLNYRVGKIKDSGKSIPINSAADLIQHQNLMCQPA